MTEAKVSSAVYLRYIFVNYYGLLEEDLIIEMNQYGKPHLRDYPNLYFNVSHTKGQIVCAVSEMPVGVDIERIKPFNKRIPERFFTTNEFAYVFSLSAGQEERFTEIWTKKEAYIKWIGKGLELPLESFDSLSQMNIKSIQYSDFCISICSGDGFENSDVFNIIPVAFDSASIMGLIPIH